MKLQLSAGLAGLAMLFAPLVTFAEPSQRYVVTAVELENDPSQLSTFLDDARELASATIKEPGCRQYSVLQGATNGDQIFLYGPASGASTPQGRRITVTGAKVCYDECGFSSPKEPRSLRSCPAAKTAWAYLMVQRKGG